eukprot:TRINITY_DN59829_c0_g1_i1.p1 TRINITY_DN59829_c0_g1~~TRINITY_DN59829_c0_g1_i1.p1  ORF type:complete len:298 (+),score=92.88 TRINITY_DN59829_c0_g1_i1:121-1014(+)
MVVLTEGISYVPGDRVGYLTTSTKKWIEAVVMKANDDGTYDLNVKRGVPRDAMLPASECKDLQKAKAAETDAFDDLLEVSNAVVSVEDDGIKKERIKDEDNDNPTCTVLAVVHEKEKKKKKRKRSSSSSSSSRVRHEAKKRGKRAKELSKSTAHAKHREKTLLELIQEAAGELQEGSRVRIINLKDAKELNETEGTCVEWLEERNRWLVYLDKTRQQKSLRVENLLAIEGNLGKSEACRRRADNSPSLDPRYYPGDPIFRKRRRRRRGPPPSDGRRRYDDSRSPSPRYASNRRRRDR